ncbi:hypothetical protein MMC22_010451 [Lobaria immixta]|nr:hypothetical protein [Lobaria immixta]
MNPQKPLGHRWERGGGVVLRQQSAKPVLRRLVDDAVGRVAAGKTDVASVAWGGEQARGDLLGVEARRGGWSGGGVVGGSVLCSCVEVVVAAMLGKVALGFERETCPAVAQVPVKEAHGWGKAFAVSGGGRFASVIDAGVSAHRWIVARVRLDIVRYCVSRRADFYYVSIRVVCSTGSLAGFYALCEFIPRFPRAASAVTMGEAPIDQVLYVRPASSAADKMVFSAFTSHVLWSPKSECTHPQEGLEWGSNRLREATWREASDAIEAVVCPRFDGRDGESGCGGGSAGVKNEDD